MKIESSLDKFKEAIKNHKPLTINYGKGIITDKNIKDYATWNGTAYADETGVWSIELLLEIAKGKVEGITIEL